MYEVTIVDMKTGLSRICKMNLDWHDSSLFWWTEGNFGCDCNRELQFIAAEREVTDEEWDAVQCGQSRFRVPEARLEDGRVIKIDTE